MAAPVAQEELPILEAVINIRNRLTALKKDRGEFIKPADVNSLYQAVIKQVTRLNEVRDEQQTYNNRLDTTMADVFNLLSLFFMTIGKTNECPATYSQIASMRQILDHMNESGVYNESDLNPFHKRIAELRQIIKSDEENKRHPKAMVTLLERQLKDCDAILKALQDSLSVISPELIPIHERLVNIRRQLVALTAKDKLKHTEVKPLLEELRKIDSKRVDGKFLGPNGTIPTSQAACSSLLEECFDITQEIKAQDESKHVADSLKPIFDRLTGIRRELEGFALTHRWSLRETDLWNYTLSLQEIDKMRVDGKFVDLEKNVPQGQYALLYLLRRCYGILHRLLLSSEPVSEELVPIANKLSTVKKCLNEVLKYGGSFSTRDLYPYQLALYQIDSLRVNGRFHGADGSIPEGQAIIMANLNECHELIEMLKEQLNNEQDEEDEEDDEDEEDLLDEEEED
ncbi:hypothetical protein BJ322DRAFT_1093002 [Thelephora terrestris]|uniref:Uncharacterized protein n=1 Tax=Thelephora terrestris TaxID=56493 RepID=A0A9P6L0X2_9AGAM|nr:hypothetical protein BJ322DRAFT_1093002 [Thelephora terrestris]